MQIHFDVSDQNWIAAGFPARLYLSMEHDTGIEDSVAALISEYIDLDQLCGQLAKVANVKNQPPNFKQLTP